jgi:serine/threonine-protein kinase
VDDGRFQLERQLGERGTTFLARGSGATPVVVKLAADGRDPDLAELIRAEYLTLAQLSHHGLEKVLACGVEPDGVPWFAAEFLDGLSLDSATAPLRGEPSTGGANVCDYAALADVTAQICRGLHHLHARGLVHGDVTPANVLVTPHADRASASRHRAVLVDLGLSQPEHETLHPDTVRGTWGYMAPEMLLGQAPTRQSDLYAFGVALHVALTGERPFLADAPDVLLDAQRAGLPRDFALHHPSVPLGFEAVLRRLLAPDPTERYDSANSVIRELNGYTGSDLREEPPPAWGATTCWPRWSHVAPGLASRMLCRSLR